MKIRVGQYLCQARNGKISDEKVKHGAFETEETRNIHREAGWLINFDAFCVSPCTFELWPLACLSLPCLKEPLLDIIVCDSRLADSPRLPFPVWQDQL
jgi:hypothetical protein